MADKKTTLVVAVASAPKIMAELTRAFIEKKDLKSRVQIRLRIKAILDLLSVDTEYPASATPKPTPSLPEQLVGSHTLQYASAAGGEQVPPEIAPIPGAAEARDNGIVLG